MDQSTSGPVLPWAVVEQAKEAAAAEFIAGAPQPIELLGHKLGDRIEVKWLLEEDGQEPCSKWWPATIQAQAPATGTAWEPAYAIRYDKFEDFEEEVATVTFVDAHALCVVPDDHAEGDAEVLAWRREGEEWEEAEEEGDEEDPLQRNWGDPSATYSVPELEARGVLTPAATEEAAVQDLLSRLEPRQQHAVASGMREFADQLKAYLAARLNGDSKDLVVTADMVKEFDANMRSAAMAKRRGA